MVNNTIEKPAFDLTIEVLDRRVEMMVAAAGCSSTCCTSSTTIIIISPVEQA
jgi:hypothetical protein